MKRRIINCKIAILAYLTFLGILITFTEPCKAQTASSTTSCSNNQTNYDFIIIGGGTAGLTISTRLNQNLPNLCILILEAGQEDGRNEPRIYIPGLKGSTIGTEYDWNLTTIPQTNASDRRFAMTRGKVLGGSSALNLMTWDRGSRVDYDAWEDLGNPGWNWSSMYESMLKVENFSTSAEYDVGVGGEGDQGVGFGGPIQTLINRILPEHQKFFPLTMENLGVRGNNQSLDGFPIGVERQPSNIRQSNYTRSYSPTYLDLANENLILRLGTRVSRINFNGTTAIGVTLEDGTVINASKEVILSAGSLQSPGLLEISGIGNKDILKAAGINQTIYHLPGVGENLQDHIRVQNSYQLKPGYLSFDILRYNTTFATEQMDLYNASKPSEYDYTGSGYAYLNWSQVSNNNNTTETTTLITLAQDSANATSPIDKKKLTYLTDPNLSSQVPQLELIFSDGYTGVKGYPTINSTLYGAEFFTLIASIQHPFSLGSVHINTTSIADPPIINPNYLSHPYDLAAAKTAAMYLRKVASTAPLSTVWTTEYEPGSIVSTDSDEEWEAYVRNTTLSIYHPIGTCAMLPESDGGVVSPELKVYGIEGLRVVDASVMPILISAHIQTAVYGIAERAAGIILEQWRDERSGRL